MPIRLSIALGCACLIALAIGPATAAADSRWVNLRVVTSGGTTLAEHRQYTGPVEVRASEKADCFGEGNPSSNRRYEIAQPTPLGALVDGGSFDGDLTPLLLTDAFVDDGFGLGVCKIGLYEISGFAFWYLAHDHVGATVGPELITVAERDDVLWYLTSGNEPGLPNELLLEAPARAKPGQEIEVRVSRFSSDGVRSAAAGVEVSDADASTDADGETTVTLDAGNKALQATGEIDDVPSNTERVCVRKRLRKCPKGEATKILGSPESDRIKGTRGSDRVKAGPGRDKLNLRNGGRDRVNCGPGRDKVKLKRRDRDDRVKRNCEKVTRRK